MSILTQYIYIYTQCSVSSYGLPGIWDKKKQQRMIHEMFLTDAKSQNYNDGEFHDWLFERFLTRLNDIPSLFCDFSFNTRKAYIGTHGRPEALFSL